MGQKQSPRVRERRVRGRAVSRSLPVSCPRCQRLLGRTRGFPPTFLHVAGKKESRIQIQTPESRSEDKRRNQAWGWGVPSGIPGLPCHHLFRGSYGGLISPGHISKRCHGLGQVAWGRAMGVDRCSEPCGRHGHVLWSVVPWAHLEEGGASDASDRCLPPAAS